MGNPVFHRGKIAWIGGDEDGTDVVEVFFRSAFPEEIQLMNHDGLRRREPAGAEGAVESPSMLKLPVGEFILARQIAICPKSAMLM